MTEVAQSAQQGVDEAQHYLGLMYEKGEGVPEDYAEAVKWYRLAAEQGRADAQYALGIKYAKGKGVPQDYVEAHKWLNLAASRTSEAANRDSAVRARDLIAAE